MFNWFKKTSNKPENAGKVTLLFVLNKENDFELHLNIPCVDNNEEKIEQCVNLVKFLQQHINPGLYPLVRLLLEKAVVIQPELIVDCKAINNLLNQIEQHKLDPIVKPTDVFTLKGQ